MFLPIDTLGIFQQAIADHEADMETSQHMDQSPSDSSSMDSDDSQANPRPTKKSKKNTTMKQPVKVYNKTGKPILLASAKRQIRRQKQRAKAEPKYVELADGQKAYLGQRRSKYIVLLEKLNQDLAHVQQELVKQKSLNQTLYNNNQNLHQQLNGGQSSPDELQAQFLQSTQTSSQMMQAYASNHVYDFFKMSSPVMIVLQDFNFRVIDANAAFLQEHGWTRSEIIGRRLPLMHINIFFTSGYDQNRIPVDDQDIPPLHAGLPRGMSPDQMHGNPATCQIYQNLFRGKIDTATVREMVLDGKGRLFKTTLTNWLAYYKDETSCESSSNVSEPILSRPSTHADDAFRSLCGIQSTQPPYHPEKGHPKYFVSMECASDREYIRPSSNTKISWNHPYPLKQIAQLAEQVSGRHQSTGHLNVVKLGQATEICAPNSPASTTSSTSTSTSSSTSTSAAATPMPSPMSSPKPIVTSTLAPHMSPANSPTSANKRKYATAFTPPSPRPSPSPSTATTTTCTTTTTTTTLGSLPIHLQHAALVAMAANRAQHLLQQGQGPVQTPSQIQVHGQGAGQTSSYSPLSLPTPVSVQMPVQVQVPALPPTPLMCSLPMHMMPMTAHPFDLSWAPTNIPFSSDLHAPAVAAPW